MEPNETTLANLGDNPPNPVPPEALSDALYREYLTGYIIGRSGTTIGPIAPNIPIANLALAALGLSDAKSNFSASSKSEVKQALLNLGLTIPPA